MQYRVLQKQRKREAKKRIKKLLEFRNALVEEYEKLNTADNEINIDQENFNYQLYNDHQLEQIFKNQLDNQILEVFLRSDMFTHMHEKIQKIKESHKIEEKSKEFAMTSTRDIEGKVRS